MTLTARVLTLTYLLNRKIKEYYKHFNVSIYLNKILLKLKLTHKELQ